MDIACGCDIDETSLKLLEAMLRESVNTYNANMMRFCDVVLEQCGLIKSENKVKKRTDLVGPLRALAHVVRQDFFSKHTRLVLRTFFTKLEFSDDQSKLMSALYAN